MEIKNIYLVLLLPIKAFTQHLLFKYMMRCLDWSISRGLLRAATCGELPELSETFAERSTGAPLLSAAESINNNKADFLNDSLNVYVMYERCQ